MSGCCHGKIKIKGGGCIIRKSDYPDVDNDLFPWKQNKTTGGQRGEGRAEFCPPSSTV